MINDPQGTITSPGYPNNYQNDLDNVHLINALPDQIIELKLVDLNTENRFDHLTVFDGGDLFKSKQIGRFTGQNETVPVTLLTSQNKAIIRFFTDGSINSYRGFKLEFKAVSKF